MTDQTRGVPRTAKAPTLEPGRAWGLSGSIRESRLVSAISSRVDRLATMPASPGCSARPVGRSWIVCGVMSPDMPASDCIPPVPILLLTRIAAGRQKTQRRTVPPCCFQCACQKPPSARQRAKTPFLLRRASLGWTLRTSSFPSLNDGFWLILP